MERQTKGDHYIQSKLNAIAITTYRGGGGTNAKKEDLNPGFVYRVRLYHIKLLINCFESLCYEKKFQNFISYYNTLKKESRSLICNVFNFN